MKDAASKSYLAAIHDLPCVICDAFGEQQLSRTEAHHVYHERYEDRKTPDNQAIPLCNGHHTGDKDNTKLAIHRAKAEWAERYGFDHEYSDVTRDRIEGNQ